MSLSAWLFAGGLLLLATSLASGWIRHTPVTSFAMYVVAGIALGPWGLGLAHIDLLGHARLLEGITGTVLVVSLFIGGLKLRPAWRDARWRMALRLALPAMLLTIAGMAWASHALLGLPWALALMFGAMVAPTDPVLASLVSVDDARDEDALRVALSAEAGLNDGAALPLLLLALLLIDPSPGHEALWRWAWIDVAWALPAGLLIGFGLARAVGSLATRARLRSGDTEPSDLLALALLALTCAIAQALHASVFLAAFAAGLGLRRTEREVVSRHPSPAMEAEADDAAHPPAEVLINPNRRDRMAMEPASSIGLVISDALAMGETAERLIAAGLTFLLGIAFASHWSPAGALMALLLFVLVRPLAVLLATVRTGAPWQRRMLLGWLGIRGIGGFNYLAYAATHGLPPQQASQLAGWMVTLVVLSVLIHGASAQPLLAWRQARLRLRRRAG